MMEWRVRADLSASGDLELQGALLDGSPVDLLVAAVAGCFVKSCHMVQEARGDTKTRVIVEVVGIKGTGSPNRVGAVTLAWDLPGLDAQTAEKVAKDAKRICTVTNTMSCDFEVTKL